MLTTAQAAAQLGIKPSWVRRLIRDGKLRASKFGASWVITQEAITEYEPRPVGRPPSENSAASDAAEGDE